MATYQTNLTITIVQTAAEAAIAVVQAMAMSSKENSQREQNVGPKQGGPLMTQPIFNLLQRQVCRTKELLNGGVYHASNL